METDPLIRLPIDPGVLLVIRARVSATIELRVLASTFSVSGRIEPLIAEVVVDRCHAVLEVGRALLVLVSLQVSTRNPYRRSRMRTDRGPVSLRSGLRLLSELVQIN